MTRGHHSKGGVFSISECLISVHISTFFIRWEIEIVDSSRNEQHEVICDFQSFYSQPSRFIFEFWIEIEREKKV